MKIPIYQIDAFAERRFGGNPAAVCPLDEWLDDRVLQAIAAENNLAETAYVVATGADGYDIRWFTPAAEVDLCGHATIASAHVVFDKLRPGTDRVTFGSKSGPLHVTKRDGRIVLDFPSRPATPVAEPSGLAQALGKKPAETLRSHALVAVFPAEQDVGDLAPDFGLLAKVDPLGVIVTAPGTDVDFVSRFFAPNLGVPEDPATGSAHCTLTPYWAARLGKDSLRARQLSARVGDMWCELAGERVRIAGRAIAYLEGTIEV